MIEWKYMWKIPQFKKNSSNKNTVYLKSEVSKAQQLSVFERISRKSFKTLLVQVI